MTEGARRRLFFALWPPDRVGAGVAQGIQAEAGSARRMPIENWHVTLAFLGHLDASQEAAARAAADAVRVPPFTLELDRLGAFPRAQVVWAGPSRVPAEGQQLARQLREGLRDRGIAVDLRPFAPHMTLLRKARRVPEGWKIAAVSWPIERFVLVHSQTLPTGSRYELIDSWALSAPVADDA